MMFMGGCAAPPVRVATDATFAPFHLVDSSGTLTGFDVELARAAVERAGLEAQVVRTGSYAALFEGLLAGEHDLVAATTGITPERRERYAFTRPTFVTSQAVLVRAGPGEPRSTGELSGRRVAAARGTTSVAAARELTPDGSLERDTVVEHDSSRAALAALRSGVVDGMVADEFEAVRLAKEHADIRVLPEPATLERYAFVLRLEDERLRARLDAALEALEEDGTTARLRARFGLERAADWPVRSPDR